MPAQDVYSVHTERPQVCSTFREMLPCTSLCYVMSVVYVMQARKIDIYKPLAMSSLSAYSSPAETDCRYESRHVTSCRAVPYALCCTCLLFMCHMYNSE